MKPITGRSRKSTTPIITAHASASWDIPKFKLGVIKVVRVVIKVEIVVIVVTKSFIFVFVVNNYKKIQFL
jgi:hypothetical protein